MQLDLVAKKDPQNNSTDPSQSRDGARQATAAGAVSSKNKQKQVKIKPGVSLVDEFLLKWRAEGMDVSTANIFGMVLTKLIELTIDEELRTAVPQAEVQALELEGISRSFNPIQMSLMYRQAYMNHTNEELLDVVRIKIEKRMGE